MKKFIIFILLFSLSAQASCDWKTGIVPGPNKTFVYNEECHLEVGKLAQANKDLNSAIQLKDLAVQQSDARVQLWEKSSLDEQERLTKMDSIQHHNDILYFALGALTIIGSGYMASKLMGH